MGNLGQNQNNVLKETHFTHVDNRTSREKRPEVENENKLDAAVNYVVCHLQRRRRIIRVR